MSGGGEEGRRGGGEDKRGGKGMPKFYSVHEDMRVHCDCVCPYQASFVPRLHTPPGEKRSGEQSRISWAYSPKVVRTNEIARSVIIT